MTSRPDSLRETRRGPANLSRRPANHKLGRVVPPALNRGPLFHRIVRRYRIRAPGILGDNLDRIILNRANHRGSIKTTLAEIPALVIAGLLSTCSSQSSLHEGVLTPIRAALQAAVAITMRLPEEDIGVRRRAAATTEEVLAALPREEATMAATPGGVPEADRPADAVHLRQAAGILHRDATLTDLLAPVCNRHSLTVHRQEAPRGASCSPKNRENRREQAFLDTTP